MIGVSPGLSWIQWCTWISGSPVIPTEELVFPLVEASGGRLLSAPREGVAMGAAPRWGLTDEAEQLYVLIGDERTEVREIFPGSINSLQQKITATQPLATALVEFLGCLNTLDVSAIALVCGLWVEQVKLSHILPQPLFAEVERAEIAVCKTFGTSLSWNRWLRIRKGAPVEGVEGLWLEVDVNTLEHPLPPSAQKQWELYLAEGVSLLLVGMRSLVDWVEKTQHSSN